MKFLRKFLPRAIRSLLVGVKNGFYRYYYNRNNFGYLSDSAKIEMPLYIENSRNVFIYDGSRIGTHSSIMASNAKFIMKNNSAVAGNMMAITGNHERKIGRWFLSIKDYEKSVESDQDIIINEDVWVGMNVTLLSGVEIGRGTTIAAGAVVTKSFPPYCVIGGVPAKLLKFYWTIDEIMTHEKNLYPESERFTRVQLEEIFNKYKL